MEIGRNKLIAVAAAAAVLLALAAYYGGLFGGGQPDLALSASVSPQSPYSGDVVEFSVLVTNAGGSPVSDAVVGLFINGQPVAQKSVSLEPGAAENITMRWLASEGDYSVRIAADPGNLITEADKGNNAFSTSISVSPAERPDLLAGLPSEGMSRLYHFNATGQGMDQLALSMARSNDSNAALYAGLAGKVYDARFALADYANGSKVALASLGAGLSSDDFTAAVAALVGSDFERSQMAAAGRDVTFFSYAANATTVCAWHEKGWNRIVMYKQSMPSMVIFNNTLGETTTCLDLVGKGYNASAARAFLLPAENLRAQARTAEQPQLEAVARAGNESLYLRRFQDANGLYLLLISDSGTLVKERCLGTVLNETNRSVCRLAGASPAGGAEISAFAFMGASDMEAFERKQGPFSIFTFILANRASLTLAEGKAKNTTLGVVFPGVPEYDWSSPQFQLAQCRFPSTIWCSDFNYLNGTLNISLTQLAGHDIMLNGFKCTQELSTPNESFIFPYPLPMRANETFQLSTQCFITGSMPFTGDIMYLRANLYANYTDPATNETNLLKGSLLINNMGSAAPPGG